VLLGTLYPLFLDALNLGKISVGPPYFDTVFVPVMTPLVFLMGVGPLARWKQASIPDLWQRLRWALVVSLVTALALPLVTGKWTPMVSFGLLLAAWIVTTTIVNVRERSRGARGGLLAQLARQPRSYWGMIVAHLGVAVFIVGVTMVKGYETERDLRMDVGDTTTVGGYTFRFEGVTDAGGPKYRAARGIFDVSRDGKHVTTLFSEKRVQRRRRADDRSRDQEHVHGRPVRFAWRAGRRRRLERTRLFEAVRDLDLGRLRLHGARRTARSVGPSLSADAAPGSDAARWRIGESLGRAR
jgi:cytochrome c biogenesis factor